MALFKAAVWALIFLTKFCIISGRLSLVLCLREESFLWYMGSEVCAESVVFGRTRVYKSLLFFFIPGLFSFACRLLNCNVIVLLDTILLLKMLKITNL